ncbi:MAG: malate dehydrogenase [Candidatus Omnitrophica bacterium]|nr:malate dehydrogenase [Candidatus Omnitrophota bacterium]MCF7894835.1 malate dehydrogenase [Candidatus Omnitrophota bacterium]
MVKKISIIGVGGVGSNLAFNILNNLSIEQLVLLDINQDQAKAVAYDLEDTRGILDFSTQIEGTKNYSKIRSSDIVVFSAGIPRKEGMSRLDLLKINADIAKGAAAQIKKYSPKSIVIAITNPLDIITYLILKETGFSAKKVMGMGSSLDTSRLLNILSKKTEMPASSCQAFVFGPHSKNMLIHSISRNQKITKEVIDEVKHRGAKIVQLFKNKSAVFGPSLVCSKLIEAISNNKNQIIPLSVLLNGEYGLKNICLGNRCLINKTGVAKVIEEDLTGAQLRKLKKITLTLQETLKKIS